MSPEPDSRFVRSPRAKIKQVGSSVAVYVPEKKAIHVLNPTARVLFDLLAEPATEGDMCQALAEVTDGDPETIARDVSEALVEFTDKGLVEHEKQ
jgi:hypothetical protein